MTANKFKTSNYWIIGKHAVNAALNNKRRAKYRLCITPENQEKININILELKPEIMSRAEISKLNAQYNRYYNCLQHKALTLSS